MFQKDQKQLKVQFFHIPSRLLLQGLNQIIITKVCDAFLKTLLIICSFHRPGIKASDFDRSILTDEYVLRSHIAYLFVLRVKELACREKCEDKIPEFVFFKKLGA
jgi:hypothetical protein